METYKDSNSSIFTFENPNCVKGFWVWDPERCNTNVTIAERRKLISGGACGWKTVLVKNGFSSGSIQSVMNSAELNKSRKQGDIAGE